MEFKISFRKIRSIEDKNKIIAFLKADVLKHGGSASEIIDRFGILEEIIISESPWGLIIIQRELTKLEALVSFIEFQNSLFN